MEAFTLNLEDIVSVEEIGREDTFDITVDGNSNYYLHTNTNPILVHNCGKSEMIDLITIKLAILHEWKCAYFSPENYPVKAHVAKIIEKIVGNKFNTQSTSQDLYNTTKLFVKDNFFWVVPPTSNTVDDILLIIKKSIKTKGIRVAVIDPWNTIEHEGSYDSQGKVLQKLVKFARENKILLILAAHPRKLTTSKETGKYLKMSPYDIAGSSDFWNMCDYMLLLHRKQGDDLNFINEGELQIAKVKLKYLGSQGLVDWRYNYKNGRYASFDKEFDETFWLSKGVEEKEDALPKVIDNHGFFKSLNLEVPF